MATEKRLIDANALIKDWNELTQRMVRDTDGKIPVDFGLVIRELSKAPTVDSVEVVHGQWIEWYPPMHMIMTGEEMLFRCSACDAKYSGVEGYRYCPNCGAKMDGGNDK